MQLKYIVLVLGVASVFTTGVMMSCANIFQLPEVQCLIPGVSDNTILLKDDEDTLTSGAVYTRPVYQTACGSVLLQNRERTDRIINEYVDFFDPYLANKLVLQPYDAKVEQDLAFSNTNLLTCRQYHYETVGNWLAYYQYIPAYCVTTLTLNFCGRAWRLDFIPFITYLISYPSGVTFSYLALILVGIGKTLQLIGQGRLWLLLKPTPLAVLGFVVLCPTLFFLTSLIISLDIGALGWIVMVWVVVKLITLGGVVPHPDNQNSLVP